MNRTPRAASFFEKSRERNLGSTVPDMTEYVKVKQGVLQCVTKNSLIFHHIIIKFINGIHGDLLKLLLQSFMQTYFFRITRKLN